MASGDVGARFGKFKVDRAGVREIFHSSGMEAELGSLSARKASEANGLAHIHGKFKVTPYGHDVHRTYGTSVGVVYTRTKMAAVDARIHHTLDSVNH